MATPLPRGAAVAFLLAGPLLAGALVVAAGGRQGEARAAAPPLLVSAAASLSGPLQALAVPFARAQGAALPQFNFGASGLLQQQIQQGAPADVFLSAGARPMDSLEKAGLLLAGSRRDVLGNRLVLVVPARSPRRPLAIQGLAGPGVRRIAIGDGTVPAGDYARQVLNHYGLTAAVVPKLVPQGSVRAVARAVADGNVDAGFVYRSDAVQLGGLRVVATAPLTSHAPIRYSGAVLRSSRQPQLARAYLRSLGRPAARALFRREGFETLPDRSP
ncbi:molybdate ABC transporter substrate-binding protein [Synechococcus sp. CCY 0621]|uniref:molybdate ABC transporter substrate-binding protein n=1 Tax=Synechococcus sp. CCY 0621 TaxID=2815603 RepID=UPI001C233AAF|nr:molybdate ABC transporter substrate-binding protein [Synechococcus sp. CCY 0621]